MSFDYSGLAQTATDLIALFGRPATLRLPSPTLIDSDRPWEGPAPLGTGAQAIPVTAVFFNEQRDAFTTTGAGIGRGSTPAEERRGRVLVASSTAIPEELGIDWYLDDGIRRLAVIASRPQKPGPTLLYYEMVVRL